MVWGLWAPPLAPHEGHMYHMKKIEFLAPRDDSCQVWLKSNHALLHNYIICMVWGLWAPPLAPHEGHMYHMKKIEFLAPRDDSCQVWLKSNHALSKRK